MKGVYIRFWILVFLWLAALPRYADAQSSGGYTPPGGEVTRPGFQGKIKLYYSATWELTTQEKSVFRRETSIDLVNMVFTGVYRDYSRENKLIGDGYYDEGVKRGLHSQYFEDGSIKSTYEYDDAGFIIWELVNDKKEIQVTRGSGKFTTYFYDFEETDHTIKLHTGILSGEFIFGKRTGVWTYEDTDHKITDEETYERGKFIKRTTYTKSGAIEHHAKKPVIASLTSLVVEAFNVDQTSYSYLNQYFEQYPPEYPASFERTITFPGSMKRLLLLLAVNLQYQLDENMVARLTVDEHGQLKKIKGPFVIGFNFDKEFERVIKPHEGKFLPAMRNGKPYAMTLRIPISNTPEWITYLQTVPFDDVNAYLEELNQK